MIFSRENTKTKQLNFKPEGNTMLFKEPMTFEDFHPQKISQFRNVYEHAYR